MAQQRKRQAKHNGTALLAYSLPRGLTRYAVRTIVDGKRGIFKTQPVIVHKKKKSCIKDKGEKNNPVSHLKRGMKKRAQKQLIPNAAYSCLRKCGLRPQMTESRLIHSVACTVRPALFFLFFFSLLCKQARIIVALLLSLMLFFPLFCVKLA